MKTTKHPKARILGGLAVAVAALLLTPAAKANVYATDIQINSTLTGAVSVTGGSSVTLSYHLNDNATAGVTINVLSNATVVSSTSIASPNAGTLMGSNSVSLTTPGAAGNYSISITAASTGYPSWQQISPLTTNYAAVFPLGMAVDKNTNSPYYGRVVLGCAANGTAHGVAQNCGFYKFNADGTPADEGSFGYAAYATNDGGIIGTGRMAPGTFAGNFQINNPATVRVGEDDRIYWSDNSHGGCIVACDIQATNYQVILPRSGYANNPGYLSGNFNNNGYGFIQFDVINTATNSTYTGANGIYTGGQAALVICDYGDFPNVGSWMWHLVGTAGTMVTDPTDSYGQQIVNVGSPSDTLTLRTDGITLDYNLDVFAGEGRSNPGDTAPRAAGWTNWNGGVLPPGDQGGAQGGGFNYAEIGGALWSEGGGSTSATDANVFDVVLNSKAKPTLLARSHQGGNGKGIDLLVPLNPTVNVTSAALSGTTLTVNCTSSSPYAPVAAQLLLISSSTVNGTYSPVAATFTGSNGVFQATTTVSGPTGFYKVGAPTTAGTVVNGSIVTVTGSGNVTGTLAAIDNSDIYWSGVDFDNVGNLYGANVSDNYWRVWSPPGPNTNSTVAVVGLTTH